MDNAHRSPVRWMFAYACLLHFVWGVLMITHGEEVSLLMSVATLDEMIPGPLWVTALLLIGSSVLAVFGMRWNGSVRGYRCLIPQQLLMVVWGTVSVHTICGGAVFADHALVSALGRDHVRGFLLAVEAQTILACTLHTLTMFDVYGGEVIREWMSRLGPNSSR